MRTLWSLTVANVRSLVRDRAALFWTIFFPIMFVFLFGAIFGGSSDTRISVGYVDQDGTAASAGLRGAFSSVKLLNLHDGSLDDEKAAMQRGDVSAVIVIPKGLQDAVVQAKTGSKASAAIQVYGDPSQSQTSQVIAGVVAQVANGFNLAAQGGTAIITVSSVSLQSTSISSVAYLVPSILAMALMQLGIFAAIPWSSSARRGSSSGSAQRRWPAGSWSAATCCCG